MFGNRIDKECFKMNSFHFLVSKMVILIGFKILSIPMGYIDIGMIYFLMTSAFVLSFVFIYETPRSEIIVLQLYRILIWI